MATESKPYLGRCKSCDYAVFAAAEDVPDGLNYRDVLPGGVCNVRGRVFGRCNNGHRFFPLRQIEGTYSEDFKCDSRCLNAKGHKCRCSCGGLNHGRGHAVKLQPVQAHAAIVAKEPAAFGGRDFDEDDFAFHSPRQGGTIEDRSWSPIGIVNPQTNSIKIDVLATKGYLGAVAEKIYFDGELKEKREINNSILHVFIAYEDPPETGEAKIEWWMPNYVNDPGFEVGKVYPLRAKVKRHDDTPRWGKVTVVTYLEEI